MAESNYTIMRNRMRGEFVKYDQEKMIRKFSLEQDETFIYIEFISRKYRIHRQNGVVEWSDDGFQTAAEADYNESMTIYDVLCNSKEDCHLAGKFCPSSMLKGTVHSFGSGGNLFNKAAEEFDGKRKELEYACDILGKRIDMNGDVAAELYPFPFLPMILQFWESDDEFPANIKFMFDENILDYMHFETTFFMRGHLLKRIREIMDQYDKK